MTISDLGVRPRHERGLGPEQRGDDGRPVDEVSSALGECFADLGFGGSIECDPFAEDCPCEEKCMPYANDGDDSWNALMCTPVAPDPKQVGQPCTVEGNGEPERHRRL